MRSSETTRPAPQNMAIVPSVSTSALVLDAPEGSLASSGQPAPGERFDLVAIVTSVILTRACAVAGRPVMAALRYGSISGKTNRVTVVTWRAVADSAPMLRPVRHGRAASAAPRRFRRPLARRRQHRWR